MQIGMIGLGRMGSNIVRRLARENHNAVVYDLNPNTVAALADEGATGASDLADLVYKLDRPRSVWIMLPAGDATESTVGQLSELLEPGDAIIDGGNSYWRDDLRRSKALKLKGIDYVDIGTSGGVWGLERGFCMMIGGDKAAVQRLEPILNTLAPGPGDIPRTQRRNGKLFTAERGYIHAGPSGAGHFVKMIHNGIEYGLMQAYAEGFDILRNAGSPSIPEEFRFDFDLADIAEVWRHGSVITSWLLDLTASALARDAKLSEFSGHVEDSGEGRWAIMTAVEEAVPAEVLSAALFARFRSRQQHTFAEKVLSAMRKGFGGHIEPTTSSKE